MMERSSNVYLILDLKVRNPESFRDYSTGYQRLNPQQICYKSAKGLQQMRDMAGLAEERTNLLRSSVTSVRSNFLCRLLPEFSGHSPSP
jgi:hypothetical protein